MAGGSFFLRFAWEHTRTRVPSMNVHGLENSSTTWGSNSSKSSILECQSFALRFSYNVLCHYHKPSSVSNLLLYQSSIRELKRISHCNVIIASDVKQVIRHGLIDTQAKLIVDAWTNKTRFISYRCTSACRKVMNKHTITIKYWTYNCIKIRNTEKTKTSLGEYAKEESWE